MACYANPGESHHREVGVLDLRALVVLLVVVLLLCLIVAFLPLEPQGKQIAYVVVVVFALVGLLKALGVF